MCRRSQQAAFIFSSHQARRNFPRAGWPSHVAQWHRSALEIGPRIGHGSVSKTGVYVLECA
eukprot:352421-Chlamydomonas_euryale.AAC.28